MAVGVVVTCVAVRAMTKSAPPPGAVKICVCTWAVVGGLMGGVAICFQVFASSAVCQI